MIPRTSDGIFKNLAQAVNKILAGNGSYNELEAALNLCLKFWPEILEEDPIVPPLKPRCSKEALEWLKNTRD